MSSFTSPQITESFVSDVVATLNMGIPRFQMRSFHFACHNREVISALVSQSTSLIPPSATSNRSPNILFAAKRPKKALILQLDATGILICSLRQWMHGTNR